TYYLQGTRISSNMVEMLQKYYRNEIAITADEIDTEYQIFMHAGEKANYYKSDNELKPIIPVLAEKIRKETNIAKMLRYADEYFIWSEHLQLDTNQLENEYKARLNIIIYDKVMKETIQYLTFGIGTFHLQSQTNINIFKGVEEIVKNKVIYEYIRYSGYVEDVEEYKKGVLIDGMEE
ncbi:MAG: hypothetical protein K2I03_00595, partial [Lachnospiraceae bacterium]|nr:hypothetical protein [Lachnospiraceae bacterium]